MNKHIKNIVLVLIAAAAALFTGCTAPQGTSNAQRYAVNGGVLGAIAGGVIGHQSDHAVEGAIIGLATGAGGGYVIGNEKDKRLTQAQINQIYTQQQSQQAQQPRQVVVQQPQPTNVPRQVITRDSQWHRAPNGEYTLEPKVNITNIYGNVNVGGNGGYRRPPPRRAFPIPRCF